MASFEMTQPGMLFGQGDGFGGLAHTGLSAFRGFKTAQDFYETQRQLEMQRMLDQFRFPAQAAQYQNQFQTNQLGAQQGADAFSALMAARAPEVPNQQAPQQLPMSPVNPTQLAPMGVAQNITRPTVAPVVNTPTQQTMDAQALEQALRRKMEESYLNQFGLGYR